mmetsp:Transcript_3617/g.4921  ORF Transcript_3617/g.4921 Transcript_3617/m.4921 type:complete len:372 (+) Transcript_3617:82-1197(+)
MRFILLTSALYLTHSVLGLLSGTSIRVAKLQRTFDEQWISTLSIRSMESGDEDFAVKYDKDMSSSQEGSNFSGTGVQDDSVIETIAGGTAQIFQQLIRSGNVMFWRPHKPTQDLRRNHFDNTNSEFRYKSPRMSQEGYALTILKNSRKRNKPVLWRYALQKYNEMDVPRQNIHHEGALSACAKLGKYREALEILMHVTKESKMSGDDQMIRSVYVTEGMLYNVIKACVRASRRLEKREDKIRILNYAKSIVLKAERAYGIKIESYVVNPLVARYQRLNCYAETDELLDVLTEKVGDAETLNVNDFGAKDMASYGLIVQEQVANENWAEAITALKNMTDHGIFPKERQINSWNEVATKNLRGFRKDIWTEEF